MLTTIKEEFPSVRPESQKCLIVRRILRMPWVQQRERRNDDLARIKHDGTSDDVRHRRFAQHADFKGTERVEQVGHQRGVDWLCLSRWRHSSLA